MFVVVALALVANIYARPTWDKLDNYTFEQYVADFSQNYEEGSKEWEMRRLIFIGELARVKTHNAKNLSWKEGVNKFTVMTPEEKKAYFGRSKGVKRNYKPKYAKLPSVEETSVDRLPRSLDWRNAGIVSAVKDQGYCGSCWYVYFCSRFFNLKDFT
jgi:C1A family cysteine protease